MDIHGPDWERYEAQFMRLAEDIELQKAPLPALSSAKMMLCLYGENGLSPEQEFTLLNTLAKEKDRLEGAIMTTAYWEDIILFVP